VKKIRLKVAVLVVTGGIVAAGCGSSSSPPPPGDPPPPPPPAAVDFTVFVKDRFAATADDSDPEAVDETVFEFNDQDNPDAFSDLLANP
jgi:hypothetical protein